jgi:hypothetical protein
MQMTVRVAVCVHDGIVFAADSAASLVANVGGRLAVTNVYKHGNKVFNLWKGLPICAMTCGMGNIGHTPINTLAKDLRRLLKSGGADYKIDQAKYTIDDISTKARKFLYEDKYMRAGPFVGDHSLEFWVGGYSTNSETHELRKITIINGNCDPPELLCGAGKSGIFPGGQIEPILRLVIGFDASLETALSAAGVAAKDVPPLLGMVKARSERFLCNESMPIQDAIDLADFLVDMTKRFFRFLPILLQKSLMASTNSDSVTAAVRFAVEVGDDGAAQ